MTVREQWEDVAFQVFEDESGAIRSGYYPTGEGLVYGNVAIDREWGNFPIQPNDDRDWAKLSANDSHSIALTAWNNYPQLSSSANYMITGLEYLGGVTYEFTAQNNLKAGDLVRISNLDGIWEDFDATVTYADANKFQFEDEKGEPPKLTGLYGRVDVNLNISGRQLEGKDAAALFPAVGVCNTGWFSENKLSDVTKELIAIGCPPEWMTDAKFVGGETWYDLQNSEYDETSGVIFWTYVDPTYEFGADANGKIIYGSSLDGIVIASGASPNEEININPPFKGDFAITVFQSHNPNLNTAGWL